MINYYVQSRWPIMPDRWLDPLPAPVKLLLFRVQVPRSEYEAVLGL